MEKEKQLKEAFQRIKVDIDSLKKENDLFKEFISDTHNKVVDTLEIIKKLTEINLNLFNNLEELKESKIRIESPYISTDSSTHKNLISTYSTRITSPNTQILPISIGNKGVPTDRQTDQQTDRQTNKCSHNPSEIISQEDKTSIQDASKILDSLDNLKKEIRLKFKRLTEQELLVFSTIYQIEEEGGYPDYKSLSTRLNLTESSIRDYVRKLLKKGIPLNKIKLNNKNVQISVSNNLKKIASLQTILHLRDL